MVDKDVVTRDLRRGWTLPPRIPRGAMPQVDEADYPALWAWAKKSGVEVYMTVYPDPLVLQPRQRIEMHRGGMPVSERECPILVSADRFILDGNHRWRECCILGRDIGAAVIGLPFDEAIAFLFSFPGTYHIVDGKKVKS